MESCSNQIFTENDAEIFTENFAEIFAENVAIVKFGSCCLP